MVRPGFAFSAGAGVGAGLYVFEFLNPEEKVIHGMAFFGLGLAGGPGSGASGAIRKVIEKLATQAAIKGAGAGYGLHSGTPPGYKNRTWSKIACNKAFSSDDFNHSSGRVTILGGSVAKVGLYFCYVSSSDGVVSRKPLFSSVPVTVSSQKFDLQIAATLGMWWEVFNVPNG